MDFEKGHGSIQGNTQCVEVGVQTFMFGHPYATLRTPTRYPFIVIFEPCHFDKYIFDIHKNECRIVTRIHAATNKMFIRDVYFQAEYDILHMV